MGSNFLVNCICHAPTILCVTILLYIFGVVSFIVFAWHACKEQGGQNNKITQCIICYCGVHLPIFLV